MDPEPGHDKLDTSLPSIPEIGWDGDSNLAMGTTGALKSNGAPALQTLAYDAETGKNLPVRPSDFAPAGVRLDLRSVPGAPQEWETVSNTERPKDFYDATSFYPQTGAEKKFSSEQEEMYPIVTGHDHE